MTDDQRTGLRNVPPIIVTAFALQLAYTLAHLVQRLAAGEHDYAGIDRWGMAGSGVWAMYAAMLAIGMFDLARRLIGRAAIAMRLAGISIAAVFVLGKGVEILQLVDVLPHASWFYKLDAYLFWAVGAAGAGALAFAIPPARRTFAVVAMACYLTAYQPPVLSETLVSALGLEMRGSQIFFTSLYLLRIGALFALVVGATDGLATSRQELASKGFAQTANALTLRVIATALAMMITLIAVASMGRISIGMMKFAMIGALAVNTISLALFGFGALNVARSALDGVPRFAASVAAATSLWCAGVMFSQLPHYYQILYTRDSAGSFGDERLQALSIALPIIGTLSCAVFAGAIAVFARARNDQMLGARASGAGVAYVALMLASVGISSYLVHEAKSQSGMIGMLIVAAGCGLIAQVVLARVCRAAVFVLEMEPGLPKATAKVTEPT